MDSTIDPGKLLNQLDQKFASYMIFLMTIVCLIAIILYIVYLKNLDNSQCNYMNDLYPDIDGNIRSIDPSDPDCSGNLYDYYVKTAYNSCSGGSYENNFVNICNLKAVLKQGVRGLDFQIFNIDNNPVVATSTSSSYYVKETFNYVDFSDVMSTISSYAFSSSSAPNYLDPILIHLRIMSNSQDMLNNLAQVFQDNTNIMLGKEYSFESGNTNFGKTKLTDIMGKCVLIIDKSNTGYLENQNILEYLNLTSNSIFMRAIPYNQITSNPDVNELTDFNKRGMSIVFPDNTSNPSNPSGMLCRAYGCQMVAMRYQYVDNYLEENALFFDKCSYAFCLKPARLRYIPVTIDEPIPQNPEYSYQTRNISKDYYSFNY
jgi:hypothetical protein